MSNRNQPMRAKPCPCCYGVLDDTWAAEMLEVWGLPDGPPDFAKDLCSSCQLRLAQNYGFDDESESRIRSLEPTDLADMLASRLSYVQSFMTRNGLKRTIRCEGYASGGGQCGNYATREYLDHYVCGHCESHHKRWGKKEFLRTPEGPKAFLVCADSVEEFLQKTREIAENWEDRSL